MTMTRRDVLKGITLGAGSVVLAPVLAQLKAHADGAPAPKRFDFVLQSDGFHPADAQPIGIDRAKDGPAAFADHALEKLTLPAGLEPLTPFKNRVTLIQGLNGVQVKPNHGGGYGALSGSREAKRDPLAESIDAALAKALPGATSFDPTATTRSTATTTRPPRASSSRCSSASASKPTNSPAEC